jgi:hypothetical protein
MKQLKRSECAVLPLVLKGRWYDMIASGEKKEEYRDSEVWGKRITKWFRRFIQIPEITNLVVAFQRGYHKPSMWFELNGVCSEKDIRAKHPEWGEPETPHYVISLGERVELVD